MTSKQFLNSLNRFIFKRLWIITEGSHLANDITIKVLFKSQNPIRTIKNSHNTKEVIEADATFNSLCHYILLQKCWSIKLIKFRIRATEKIDCLLRGVNEETSG